MARVYQALATGLFEAPPARSTEMGLIGFFTWLAFAPSESEKHLFEVGVASTATRQVLHRS